MGLRCLIGHEYGEPETTRERDDRGDEVVVTIREYKECARCGERQIISENTEVRATDPEPEPEPEPESEAAGGTSEFEDVTAAEDDGVILDDGSEDDERSPGEWPEEDDAEVEAAEPAEWPDAEAEEVEGIDAEADEESTAWPEHDGEDEGIDAEAPDDTGGDVTVQGGLASGSDADAPAAAGGESDVEADDASEGDDGAAGATGPAGIRSAASGPDPVDQRVAGVETTLVCPECGHSAEAVESSLRPGDICPECQRGYLTEREQ